MAIFHTSTGAISVNNWGYELQGTGGKPLDANLLSSATHDLLVIDSSRDGTNAGRFSMDEITRMKDGMGGQSVVASYISIGEASDFRDYWNRGWTAGGDASDALTGKAPDWLGPVNPDWPESRKVRYWDEDWQNVLFNEQKTGDLDAIVKAGFDAAYLDIVDAYYFWGEEAADRDRQPGDPANVKQAAQRMVDFIVAMTEHARETNPDFFVIPQNGAFILDDLGSDAARKAAFLDAIGGIAVEDVYNYGDADENNPFNPDQDKIDVLQRDFLDNGKPVFAVDYLNDAKLIDQFYKQALEDGFIPFAAPDRDLDRLVGTYDGVAAYKRPTDHADALRGSQLDDRIDGLAGNDAIYGRGGADRLYGGKGNDQLYGGGGHDKLYGGSGNDALYGGYGRDALSGGNGNDRLFGGEGRDRLFGGSGKDLLVGGDGADVFVFNTSLGGSNIDTIADFAPGQDRIWLDDDIFTAIGTVGDLSADAFHRGRGARDAGDRIIYDETTGRLSYDADGDGSFAPVQFAVLDRWLTLSAGDFDIIG